MKFFVANLIIFLLEILYYTLFIKLSKREKGFIKYFLVFLLANAISLFVGFSSFYSYLFYFVEIVLLIKLLKVKFNLFDLLVIINSMLVKILIEFIAFLILREKLDLFIWILILGIFKNLILFIFKNLLQYCYIGLYKMWVNNNFYIRYIFNIMVFVYIISSLLFNIYG
jgi:hypothetical protein